LTPNTNDYILNHITVLTFISKAKDSLSPFKIKNLLEHFQTNLSRYKMKETKMDKYTETILKAFDFPKQLREASSA